MTSESVSALIVDNFVQDEKEKPNKQVFPYVKNFYSFTRTNKKLNHGVLTSDHAIAKEPVSMNDKKNMSKQSDTIQSKTSSHTSNSGLLLIYLFLEYQNLIEIVLNRMLN